MVNLALEAYLREDVFGVLEFLAAQNPDGKVLRACQELAAKIYWDKKDLVGVVAVSLFGLSLGWRIANSLDGEEETSVIFSITKAIAYNLASFTWPGWDESGIQIGHTDLTIGLSAAKINLRLAHELNKGNLPLARANWMLAAHYLAQKEYTHAERNFALSATHALEADEQAEVLLAEGFQVLTLLLAGLRESGASEKRLNEVKEKLRLLENGSGFIGQLDTAQRVFSAS
ncbi:hypothetical protein EON83_07245 [bacterium]|nr:MAG: hypothetical protein EON83_07245 [bacterium]